MRIGLDVDGVVYDWDSSVRRILKMTYDLDIGVSRSWDHIDSRCTPEQWSSLWSGYPLMDMFTRGFYYPGAITAVETLALDHEVFFITATPPAVRKARGISLFSDFRGINGVIFVDPGSDDKTLLKCDLYVDDKQETVEYYRRAGKRAWIMDRPWNQTYFHPDVARVRNWSDLASLVFGEGL